MVLLGFGRRVILQIKLALDLRDSPLKTLTADIFAFGRVRAHAEQVVLTFGL
jgi:hypothetical protein